jgi:hypothetical protein
MKTLFTFSASTDLSSNLSVYCIGALNHPAWADCKEGGHLGWERIYNPVQTNRKITLFRTTISPLCFCGV